MPMIPGMNNAMMELLMSQGTKNASMFAGTVFDEDAKPAETPKHFPNSEFGSPITLSDITIMDDVNIETTKAIWEYELHLEYMAGLRKKGENLPLSNNAHQAFKELYDVAGERLMSLRKRLIEMQGSL